MRRCSARAAGSIARRMRGETWQQCSGHGLPEGTWGRSGVAVSSDGRRVYAVIEAKKSGLYVSDDGGDNWRLANADPRLTSRAWYFSRITVDPSDADVIYVPNVALMGSDDGGKTVHVVRGAPGGDDYHELWVDPKDSSAADSRRRPGDDDQSRSRQDVDDLVQPADGADVSRYHRRRVPLYRLWRAAGQWRRGCLQPHQSWADHAAGLVPGERERERLYGRRSQRPEHSLCERKLWGGRRAGTGGVRSRRTFRRGRCRSLAPRSTDRKYRDPWTPPLVFSPVDKTSLYLGTQYLMKTTDGGLHWAQISPDLTGSTVKKADATAAQTGSGAAASARNSIGDVDDPDHPTPENAIERGYGTLATVAPSYLDKDVLWTGSDTGVISLTRDGGKSWTNVTPAGMQRWGRVSLIDPSHFDPAVAYAAVERHRMDDQTPYIYRTRDYGKSWESITTGLAAPNFVNAIREDPKQKGLLYAGTEFGVYVSFDDGGHWQPLQLNLPVSSVRDLVIHGDDLVVATHGRSFWILDDITPLRQAAERAQSAAPFFTSRRRRSALTAMRSPARRCRLRSRPPRTRRMERFLITICRRKRTKIELRIFDGEHKLVRHVSSETASETKHASLPIAERWFPEPQRLETSAGMHRFIWNLAWGTSGVTDSDQPDDGEGDIPRGPRVPPGKYTLELDIDGKKAAPETLVVVKDPRSPASQAEIGGAIQDQLQNLRRLAPRRVAPWRRSVRSEDQLGKSIAKETETNAELKKQVSDLSAAINRLLSGQPNRQRKPWGWRKLTPLSPRPCMCRKLRSPDTVAGARALCASPQGLGCACAGVVGAQAGPSC